MVPTTKRKSSRNAKPFEPSIPGGNVLSLVTYPDGSRGFRARNEDSSISSYFNLDGEEIEPAGFVVVIRTIGEYAPGDEDGFWALVASV
jgi:hypothetical protein